MHIRADMTGSLPRVGQLACRHWMRQWHDRGGPQFKIIRRIPIALLISALALCAMWHEAEAHNPHDPVLALGISPEYSTDKTLFLATYPEMNWSYADILRSTDGGSTWTNLPNGMVNRYEFSSIRVSPSFKTDRTVFAATRGDGVFRSRDAGNSWALVNTGLSSLNIKSIDIARTGDTSYVLFGIPANGGLFRRMSNQDQWTRVIELTTKLNLIAISPGYATDSTIMAVDAANKLLISTNGGSSWVTLGNPISATIYDLAIAPGDGQEIFAAANQSGFYYSIDGGKAFTRKTATLPNEAINNIAVSPNYLTDHTLFCTSVRHAVYRSTNGGNTWSYYKSNAFITNQTTLRNEFSDLQISTTYAADKAVFLSAYAGFYMSRNAGVSWSESQTRKMLTTGLAISPTFASDQRVMATSYYSGGLYRSYDGGSSWTGASNGWPKVVGTLSTFDIDYVQNHIGPPLVVATRNHSNFGFSSDFGSTWKILTIPDMSGIAPGDVYTNSMGLSPMYDSDQTIYLGTRQHGLIETRDGGSTWLTKHGVPLNQITSVAVSPDYGSDRTAFAANMAGQVWRTRNAGDTWSRVGAAVITPSSGLKYMWIALSPNYVIDRLVLVATNNGIYSSVNGGDDWTPLINADVGKSKVVQRVEFSPYFASDQTAYAVVRGKGMYRMIINETGQVASSSNVGLPLLANNIQFIEFRLSPSFGLDATILGASRDAVYRSTTGGGDWSLAGYPGAPSGP